MEGTVKHGTVYDFLKNDLDETYHHKTHVRLDKNNYVDFGITGFYTRAELLKYYAECHCETVYYEKEFGADEDGRSCICTLSFLVVYADTNYHMEIMKERGGK